MNICISDTETTSYFPLFGSQNADNQVFTSRQENEKTWPTQEKDIDIGGSLWSAYDETYRWQALCIHSVLQSAF